MRCLVVSFWIWYWWVEFFFHEFTGTDIWCWIWYRFYLIARRITRLNQRKLKVPPWTSLLSSKTAPLVYFLRYFLIRHSFLTIGATFCTQTLEFALQFIVMTLSLVNSWHSDNCLMFPFSIYAFQCRKAKDLYLWMAKCPNGPSVKFLVSAGNILWSLS